MKIKSLKTALILIILLFSVPVESLCQFRLAEPEKAEYRKQEINWGLNFSSVKQRESLKTDSSGYFEEMTNGTISLFASNKFWHFNEYKQEQFSFSAKAGPLWGKGSWNDSTKIQEIDADHRIAGFRGYAMADYSYRYYYTNQSYTIVKLNGWGQYDWYRQSSEGTLTDSNLVVSGYSDVTKGGRWKAGIDARAGWGLGRLAATNHIMLAEYILEKYYPEKSFSQEEIQALAHVIGKVKNNREIVTGHITEKELIPVMEFLNQRMFLLPKNIEANDWELGEFLPRYHGNRVEFGPFFQYYNKEPDFVYGGYLLYESAKYINRKWNRNLSAAVNYNAYKHNDWVLGEITLSWSNYIKLKSQFDFGVRYVPGLEIADEELNFYNGLVPYFSYFTQFNPKSRLDLKFAWRFTSDEKLMAPGPEISVSVYRSRY